MENTNITILLTGDTGLVGRHVAYELLGNIFDGKLDAEIFALVRAKGCMIPRTRIETLFSHPSMPDYLSGINTDELVNSINIIEGDLRSDTLHAAPGKKNIRLGCCSFHEPVQKRARVPGGK